MKHGPIRKVVHRIARGSLYRLSCGHHAKLRDPKIEWPCHMCQSVERRAEPPAVVNKPETDPPTTTGWWQVRKEE